MDTTATAIEQPWMKMMLAAILPVWLLGTATGMMLPRTKWCQSAFSFASSSRFAALLAEFFTNLAEAIYSWESKDWGLSFSKSTQAVGEACDGDETVCDWYVTSKDLQFFKDNVDAPKWELIMDKNIPNLIVYKAWRRILKSGKTEYKSVSIAPDATAEEFMDFYLDDDSRPLWDTMIAEHEVLEYGNFNERQMVVRWLRKFPFSFISDREYVIARRFFREAEALYGITKAVDHPAAKKTANRTVSMDVFHSMWSCKTISCPWGTDKPACETTLLHHEDFKIPENLARFAAKAGMWTFVSKMAQNVAPFVQARRKRCPPAASDPLAYGYDGVCNRDGGSALASLDRSQSAPEQLQSLEVGALAAPAPARSISRIAKLAVVGGLAVVINRSLSSASLGISASGKSSASGRPLRSSAKPRGGF